MTVANLFFLLFLTLPFFGTAQTSPTQVEAEKEAILAVITEQTRAYFERDFAAWKNAHVQADYYTEFKYWEGWDDPVRAVRGWAGHEANVAPNFAPDQPKSVWNAAQYERSDIHIRLAASGDMAWVTLLPTGGRPRNQRNPWRVVRDPGHGKTRRTVEDRLPRVSLRARSAAGELELTVR
jgi:hypothetical protein